MANHDVVVIGASAGGIEAMTRLFQELPHDIPASFFVVQHTGPEGLGILDQVFGRDSALIVQNATDRAEIKRGHVYVAPPNFHLLVDRSFVYITQGPHENRVRPAVDPLFRSAAVVHGPHVIGVVLSGYLDDGTAGLAAVKRCGGIAVVQDPKDAAYPDMPRNARDAVSVDHSVPLHDMANLLVHLVKTPPGTPTSPPLDLLAEVEIARTGISSDEPLNEIGDPAPVACSECGGPMWKIRDAQVDRYRCRVGHAYTAKALIEELSVATERSLWAAIQMMDQQARMLARFAKDEREKGRAHQADNLLTRAREADVHSVHLRELLFTHSQKQSPEQISALQPAS